MKLIFTLVLLAGVGSAFVACESDLPPDSHAGSKIQRGVTGQGSLVQPDKSEDPIIRENTRVGY